jgi:DNA-binding response OmpR family regulator
MIEVINLSMIEFRLDISSRRMVMESVEVELRNKEFHLLHYFVQNAGTVLSRAQILEDVWDSSVFCNTNTIDVHVSSLRRKFKPHMKDDPIKTIHCIGYRFDL